MAFFGPSHLVRACCSNYRHPIGLLLILTDWSAYLSGSSYRSLQTPHHSSWRILYLFKPIFHFSQLHLPPPRPCPRYPRCPRCPRCPRRPRHPRPRHHQSSVSHLLTSSPVPSSFCYRLCTTLRAHPRLPDPLSQDPTSQLWTTDRWDKKVGDQPSSKATEFIHRVGLHAARKIVA